MEGKIKHIFMIDTVSPKSISQFMLYIDRSFKKKFIMLIYCSHNYPLFLLMERWNNIKNVSGRVQSHHPIEFVKNKHIYFSQFLFGIVRSFHLRVLLSAICFISIYILCCTVLPFFITPFSKTYICCVYGVCSPLH